MSDSNLEPTMEVGRGVFTAPSLEQTVMILAPLGQDARVMADLLEAEGITARICAGPDECCQQMASGAGALLLTEEALEMEGCAALLHGLETQPAWSELPLIVLTSGGEARMVRLLETATQVAESMTILERPLSAPTLLRSVQVALRSRGRQYQVRELLAEQARQQQRLRESEQRYRLLFDRNPDGVFAVDPTGRFTLMNAACEKLSGYSRAELLGKSFLELCAPDQLESTLQHFQQNLQHPDYTEMETAFIRKDGARVEVWIAGEPILADKAVLAVHCTAKDITARKAAEQALRRSEERWNAAIEHFSEGAIIATEAEQVIYWNPAARRMHGFSRAGEGIGPLEDTPKTFELWTPDGSRLLPLEEWPMRRIKRGETVRQLELRLRRPDQGWERIVTYSGALVQVPSGERLIFLSVSDLTEQRKAELALRRVSDRDAFLIRLADALRPLGDAGQIKNTASAVLGRQLRASHVAYAEVTPGGEVLLESGYADGIDPFPGRHRLEDYGRHLFGELRAGRSVIVPDVLQAADYTEEEKARYRSLRVRSNLTVPLLKQGQPVALLAVHQAGPREWTEDETLLVRETLDRTWATVERARAEQALRESEGRLALALEGGQMGMWEWDLGTHSAVWNAKEYELLGIPAGDQGPSVDLFFSRVHPEDLESLKQSLNQAVTSGQDWRHEFRIVRSLVSSSGLSPSEEVRSSRFSRSEEVRWLVGAGRVVAGPEGKPERLVGVNYDITERKEFQAELERLVTERTAKLKELVGELEHFSYTITHDMRAPLRSMRGFAELLEELCSPAEQPDQQTLIRRIITSAERMDLLITDALSYSQAVRQHLPLGPVDVGALLRGMIDSYPEFQDRKAAIRLQPGMPLVLGNQAGLTQCFSNLLGNAVKFAKPGQTPEIRIYAERMGGGTTEEARIRLWVEDRGIGISSSMLPRVFNMFARASNQHPGTGIGLALVRKVVDRMGGRAGVESELGKGSRFWIELLPGDPRESIPSVLPSPPRSPRDIL